MFNGLINVETPKQTTKKQEELLRAMKRQAKMVREIRSCCVIRLLRAYDKEASESGGTGISGRIAKAVGLAFNRIFGSEKEKIKDKKEKAKKESKEDTDDEAEQQKTAAQRADELSLARSKM